MKPQRQHKVAVPLDKLRDQMDQARSRFRRRLLIRGLFASGIATAVVFGLFELLGHDAELFPWPSASRAQASLSLALVALLLGLGWTVFHSIRATPSRLDMARRADEQFSLGERVSTALERGDDYKVSPSVIDQALIHDAVAQSIRIRPPELVTLPFPREAWYLLALLAVVVALQLMPRFVPTDRATTSGSNELTNSQELSRVGAEVRMAAELIAQDAQVKQDSYLQAVARALDELGTNLEVGAVSGDEAGRELDRLLGHLSRFYDIEATAETTSVSSYSSALKGVLGEQASSGPQVRDGKRASEAGASDSFESSGRERDEGLAGQSAPHQRLSDELQGRALPESVLDGSTEEDFPMMNMEARDLGEEADPEAVARAEQERRYLERQREAGAALGAPIGPAPNAGRGPSALAGQGTQPLTDGMEMDGGGDFDASEATLEQVSLPEASRGAGRRIEVVSAPEVQFTNVGGSSRAVEEDWRRSGEWAQSSAFLGIVNRDVVSRYFLPAGEIDASSTP